MMTHEQLARYEGLTLGVTRGLWSAERLKDGQVWVVEKETGNCLADLTSTQDAMANAHLMATAREAVPALVAEVRRLQIEASEHALNSDTWRRLAQEREAEVRRLREELRASYAQDKQAEANFARLEAEKERHQLRAVALAEALSNLLPLVRDSVPEKKAAVALLAEE